jgi:acylglycerol lipase
MKEFYIVDRGEKINILYDEYKNPSCIIIHLHGLNSHFQYIYNCQNEFEYRIKYLQKANISSYALEFYAHGKSSGEKGYIYDFDMFISNVLVLISYIEYKHPNLPIFMLGESMGGAIAIKIGIIVKKIKGIILLAPMCGMNENIKISNTTINLLYGISNIFPKIKLISSNDKYITCDNDIYNNHRKLCKYEHNSKIVLSTARECHRAILWINKYSHHFDKPIIAFHSKIDNITCPKKTQFFIDNCISKDKQLILLDESSHRLLIPTNNDDVIPDGILSKITNWINNRI